MLGAAAALLPAWPGRAAAADPAAATADEALAHERALAAAEGKGVLVEFYASWCVWCEPMDELLNHASVASIVRRRFRTLRMRVWERRGVERARQLAGADDIFTHYLAGGTGLPFLAFVDAEGRALTTSIAATTHENIGYPVGADELDWLESMLATAAPGSTERQRRAARATCVRLYRRANARL